LDDDVVAFGEYGGRTTATVAELGLFALFSDDFMDFHIWFLWREPE